MANNKKQEGLVKSVNWKQIVYVLTLGWIVIWIYRTALAPIYPEISHFFGGASDAQIGQISSWYFLGYVLMQIPSGLLVDKLGKRKILLPGFVLFGCGAVLVGGANSLQLVYLGSILAGVGCGTYYGVAYSLTAEYVPANRRSLATALVNCGTAVGSGVGMIASSFLVAQLKLPWQVMLVIVVILIILMVIIFSRYIKNPVEALSKPQVELTTTLEPRSSLGLKELVTPQMIGMYCLYFATCYAYYLTDTWLPNYLSTERGFEGATIGLAFSLVFFSAIPGAISFSRLADNYASRRIKIIVCLQGLAALSLLLAVTSSSKLMLMVGLLAYGFFGKITVEPIILSWLSESIPLKGLATTLGVFNFFGMSSSVIVPSLTGAISDATGSKVYAFYLSIIILVVGTLIFFVGDV